MIRSTDGRRIFVHTANNKVMLLSNEPQGDDWEARYTPEDAVRLGEWLLKEGHNADELAPVHPVLRQAVCLVRVHGVCVRSLDWNEPMQVNALEALFDAARHACQKALNRGYTLSGLAEAVGMPAMDFEECYGLEENK